MTKKHGFKTLYSPIHFYTAMLDGSVVLAFQDGELIGSGRISEITESTVKIADEHYIRDNCTFTYTD